MDIIDKNRNTSIARHRELFNKYGIDERSLGWTKLKQYARFEQIISRLDIRGASILDVGCGFADLYNYLLTTFPDSDFDYVGIDFVPEFIETAKQKYPNISLFNTDLFNFKSEKKYKYLINCGCLFNLDPDNEEESYEYIDAFIGKNLELCEDDGVCIFHFLTDKVDYRSSTEDFHISPERILSIAYSHSRRIVLDNSVFPFEACLFVYKDDSFRKENTIFIRAGL